MGQTITAVNIAAAALITQFSIGCILFVGAFILRGAKEAGPVGNARTMGQSMPWIVLAFSFLTIGALFFSDPYSSLWKPLLGDLGAPSIGSARALFIAFTADILVVFWLACLSGGADSPFIPIFFIQPALAIFLREGLGRVVWYVILISILFTVGCSSRLIFGRNYSNRGSVAYWFVSIACFVLSTFVGYVTRPR